MTIQMEICNSEQFRLNGRSVLKSERRAIPKPGQTMILRGFLSVTANTNFRREKIYFAKRLGIIFSVWTLLVNTHTFYLSTLPSLYGTVLDSFNKVILVIRSSSTPSNRS